MQTMRYAAIFEKTRTGYSAYLPDLPGCVAAGPTLDQVRQLLAEAVELHIAGMREDGEPIPEPSILEYVEVA
jgi:predicted RNase H-like HicB family nuclease